jgi:parallel beta-helix repeat protein
LFSQNGYWNDGIWVCANYHLSSGSPCVDRGTSTGAPSEDLDGESRPNGSGYDIGADEHVDSDGDDLPDYWELEFIGSLAEDGDDDHDLDGLTNSDELSNNTDPGNPNTDGDGFNDGDEIANGTNPNSKTYFVSDGEGNDSYDGLTPSWDGTHGPKKTINAAIVISLSGNEIFVADGTYRGSNNVNLDMGGRNILLKSLNGSADTIIDCEFLADGLYYTSGEDLYSTVDGFTITNAGPYGYGTGIYCEGSSPNILNCVITDNTSDGIYCVSSSSPKILSCSVTENGTNGIHAYDSCMPEIADCTITGNGSNGIYVEQNAYLTTYDCVISLNLNHGIYVQAESAADIHSSDITDNSNSGLYCQSCSTYNIIVNNCSITGNSADNGAGVNAYESKTLISNSIIADNTADSSGGGIYCWNASQTITNCLIVNNTANGLDTYSGGGGIYYSSDDAKIMKNSTIADNAAFQGAGIYCYSDASPNLTDCILWGNTTDQIAGDGTENPTADYCDIQNGWSGSGSNNMSADPLFVSGSANDYCLSQLLAGQPYESPCVNSGSDLAVNLGLDELSTRTDDEPDDGIVDMGYHAGYAPNVPHIYQISLAGSNITIYWQALAGTSYVVEWSTDMQNWNEVHVGPVDSWTDINPPETERYYRVRIE